MMIVKKIFVNFQFQFLFCYLDVVYVPPTSGDMLFSSDQSREPIAQSPSPPPPNRQRQSLVDI